mgnify:FL=1
MAEIAGKKKITDSEGAEVYTLQDLEGIRVTKEVLLRLYGFESMQRIYQMVQEGLIKPVSAIGTGKKAEQVYELIPNVQGYVMHLRGKATGRKANQEQAANAADADLRFRTAKAEKMELELAELKGRMHSSEDVEAIVGDMIAKLRAEILALPGGLAKDVMDAKNAAEASGIIKAAVNDLLNRMADYRYDKKDFQRRVRQREKWMNEQEEESADK